MQPFEKLGAFYLGRLYDRETSRALDAPLLYDARDLTTHAVCVGMTGSGKTGLGVTLLEEAAIDGIPALIIDPKGDMGNLMLSFPELRPEDFRPWIDAEEAARKGLPPDEFAAATARTWREGLAAWGQDGARVARLRAAADTVIYTPGSGAGAPLTLLRSFTAPAPAVADDPDALRERIAAAVSGLLALLGIPADPIRSREHILLSRLLQAAWSAGRDLDLPGLIRGIQSPPFQTVGVMDVESFFPQRERSALAMTLNNLLAAPGFAAWMEGEPLDIPSLLWTPQGRPRLAILSIAHLSEAERMFFVTILLNEVIAWMRSQSGTSSLRALLYMDEVFGYFPPTANPPCKTPMLTLLKQARAYGLGVVLATQNPVDLDYKGLANAGTWFLGRLQTERDKARVLEGLEGASAATGAGFDRQRLEAILAGLDNRVFLMNNVHEDEPVLFQTRWALSYLRGPLTRGQIQTLMAPLKAEPVKAGPAPAGAPAPARFAAPPVPAATPAIAAPPGAPREAAGSSDRPHLPPEANERFLPLEDAARGAGEPRYRPALLGRVRLHYVNARAGVDEWNTVALVAPLSMTSDGDPWEGAEELEGEGPDLDTEPGPGARFAALPAAAARAASYAAWTKALASHVYRTRTLTVLRCADLRQISRPGESERDFRVRLGQIGRESRDAAIESLRAKYAPRLASLEERIRAADQRAAVERSQYDQHKLQTAISVGATVLGALFGRKLASAGNVGRATTAMRGMGRAAREKGDISRADDRVETLRERLAELETQLQEETSRLRDAIAPEAIGLEPVSVRPRKSDISVTSVGLVWTH